MALVPGPTNPTKHLTAAPANGVLVAWHTTLDVAAYELPDRSQVLSVNGKLYSPDMRTHHHPTQLVINLCHQPKRKQAAWVKALQDLPPYTA